MSYTFIYIARFTCLHWQIGFEQPIEVLLAYAHLPIQLRHRLQRWTCYVNHNLGTILLIERHDQIEGLVEHRQLQDGLLTNAQVCSSNLTFSIECCKSYDDVGKTIYTKMAGDAAPLSHHQLQKPQLRSLQVGISVSATGGEAPSWRLVLYTTLPHPLCAGFGFGGALLALPSSG